MKSTSMNDAIWPIFIAPPRSDERASTTSSASSSWRRASSSAALSGSRTALVAMLVASLNVPGASAPVVLAARRSRPVGMRSVIREGSGPYQRTATERLTEIDSGFIIHVVGDVDLEVDMSLLVRPEPFSTEFNRLFNSL